MTTALGGLKLHAADVSDTVESRTQRRRQGFLGRAHSAIELLQISLDRLQQSLQKEQIVERLPKPLLLEGG